MSTQLARQGTANGKEWSLARDSQLRTQLEAGLNAVLRAGVLRKGKVTRTGANQVTLETDTVIFSDGIRYQTSAALPKTVAGTPSISIYLYGLLTRTAANQNNPADLDTYTFVLSYSASATPASSEHIPLAVIPLDGSGNVTGSNGDAMGDPNGKFLHPIPNLGYRNVSVAGTGTYTPSEDDLAAGGLELSGTLTGNRVVEFPLETGRFLPVLNSVTGGSYTLTFRTPGTTGVVLSRGAFALLWIGPAGVQVVASTDPAFSHAPGGAPVLTAAAESADARQVTVQLKDQAGSSLSEKREIFVIICDTAGGAECSAAPDGGVTIDTGTVRQQITANKQWRILTDTNGQAKLTLTESAVKTFVVEASDAGRIGSVSAAFV